MSGAHDATRLQWPDGLGWDVNLLKLEFLRLLNFNLFIDGSLYNKYRSELSVNIQVVLNFPPSPTHTYRNVIPIENCIYPHNQPQCYVNTQPVAYQHQQEFTTSTAPPPVHVNQALVQQQPLSTQITINRQPQRKRSSSSSMVTAGRNEFPQHSVFPLYQYSDLLRGGKYNDWCLHTICHDHWVSEEKSRSLIYLFIPKLYLNTITVSCAARLFCILCWLISLISDIFWNSNWIWIWIWMSMFVRKIVFALK